MFYKIILHILFRKVNPKVNHFAEETDLFVQTIQNRMLLFVQVTEKNKKNKYIIDFCKKAL